MENKGIQLTFLGTRGSVPVVGKEYQIYGGATACVRVLAGDEEIYLDAGSGIVRAKPRDNTHLTVLLSHLHLDHVQGLPFFAALGQANRPIAFYAADREGACAKDALDRLFSPPLWPCMLSDYPADITFCPVPDAFFVGDVQVAAMPSCHPGGSTIYRLTYGQASLVYATDFEHEPDKAEELIRFSRGADLLIYDGQYTPEEYERRKGYGHSTACAGAQIASDAQVGRLVITHHDPGHTDEWFLQMQNQYPHIIYAKDGEEMIL